MLTAKEIRESFKDFFRERGHQIVPSAPISFGKVQITFDPKISEWDNPSF